MRVRRIACICLPEFPLQLLMLRHPQWRELPAVVVDRDRAQGTLLWVNNPARASHILPGMRYAAALSLSPQLRAGVVSPADIDTAITAIVDVLRFFAAEIEPAPDTPGQFWLGASGLSLLYPSLEKWARLIIAELTGAGYTASIAVGFSRFGTAAIARTRADIACFDTVDAECHAVRAVRLDRTHIEPSLRDTLAKLGVHTVGGFVDLPEAGIQKRFGTAAQQLHRMARDELFVPLQALPPQEPVRSHVHLDYAESNLERLMAVIERELHALLRVLNDRGELLNAIDIALCFDNNQRATERLQPAAPTLELKQILELASLRLGMLRLTSGVVDIEVELHGAPAQQRQGDLFAARPRRETAAAARAFARLRAELGDGAVVHAVLRDGHLPEARYTWEPVTALAAPKPRAVQLPPRIRRIYARPVTFSPLRMHHADRVLLSHIDDGSVSETHGPYVVSGGWWQREVQREYYYVRTITGRTLWMYFDRLRQGWFLHGEVE